MNEIESDLFSNLYNLSEINEPSSFERALLIVNGVKTNNLLETYLEKLNILNFQYKNELNNDSEFSKARRLIDFLGEGKIERYLNEGFKNDMRPSRLDMVINRKISKSKYSKVGDCLGLTQLGAIIAKRNNLNLKMIFFEGHVALRLKKNGRNINLETTRKEGFNWKYKIDKDTLGEKPLEYLVPYFLYMRGICKISRGLTEEGIKDKMLSKKYFPDITYYL